MQIAVSAEECRVARLFSAITRAIADEWSGDSSATVLNASILNARRCWHSHQLSIIHPRHCPRIIQSDVPC